MQISLQLTGPAFDDIERLARTLARPRGLLRGAQKGIANELVAHFDRRNAEGNKHSWPSQNFWAGIGEHVVAESSAVTDSTASVTVGGVEGQKLAHKILGGTIEPQRGSFLAIPARQEAYGKSPLDFANLALAITGGGERGFLYERENQAIKVVADRRRGSAAGAKRVKPGAEQGGGVYFWLVKSVNQDPDARAMPPEETLGAAAQEAANDWLASLMGGRAAEAAE